MESFDLIVIGAGPGGYVAAIRGAQLGMKVAIIDKRGKLGGTCLNVGCIPSKALLDSSEHYYQAKEKFETHGIDVKGLSINFKQMMARKQAVVDNTVKGIDFLMQKNNITVYTGTAAFVDKNTVEITENKKKQSISGNNILIATGSIPTEIPAFPFDGKVVISSDHALSLKSIPKRMVVIGGGVIGSELGSVYARLGAKVTIIEYMDRLIPTMDKQCGKTLEKTLRKVGVDFHFKTKVTAIKTGKKGATVVADSNGKEVKVEADQVLVSVGRSAYTDRLNLAAIGITTDDRGRVEINENFQTVVPNVYAIGDVVRGIMLAHKASEEGVVCVEKMAGHHGHLNYNTIPNVVYTWPEVASVGQTEEELSQAGVAFKRGSFPFKASGRARAAEESDGFIKVLADKNTDEILGIHMIGPRCADLIGQALIAMEYKASAEDIGMMCIAHPTFSESLKEAALAATEDRAIHS